MTEINIKYLNIYWTKPYDQVSVLKVRCMAMLKNIFMILRILFHKILHAQVKSAKHWNGFLSHCIYMCHTLLTTPNMWLSLIVSFSQMLIKWPPQIFNLGILKHQLLNIWEIKTISRDHIFRLVSCDIGVLWLCLL